MKKIFVLLFLNLCTMFSVKAQVYFMWGKQLGSAKDDKPRNLAADLSGNIYVFGKTKGTIGNINNGKSDGFIIKIDSTAISTVV